MQYADALVPCLDPRSIVLWFLRYTAGSLESPKRYIVPSLYYIGHGCQAPRGFMRCGFVYKKCVQRCGQTG